MNEFKRLAACFSLANLCFLDKWGCLFSRAYDMAGDFYAVFLTALLGVIIFATVIFYVLDKWFLEGKSLFVRLIAYFIFVQALMFVPEELQSVLLDQKISLLPKWLWRVLPYAMGGGAMYLYYKYPVALRRGLSKALLCFLPFGLLMAGHAVRDIFFPPTQPFAAHQPHEANGPRVVWMIFDEMDYHLAFVEREREGVFPEIDRLRSESFFATRASQAGDHTIIALPSLLLGERLQGVKMVDARSLFLTRQDGSHGYWGPQENVFSRARAMGKNSALVGWHHPYDRILSKDLTECYAIAKNHSSIPTMFTSLLIKGIRKHYPIATRKLRKLLKLPGRQSDPLRKERVRRAFAHSFQETLQLAHRFVVDPQLDFSFIHWQVPHSPGIYNAVTQTLSDKAQSYFDNLLLVERTLGELRREMEAAGVWDRTCLIISSDHWLRKELITTDTFFSKDKLDALGRPGKLVPFIVKMAGSSEGVVFDEPFNAVITQSLVLAILDGRVKTPADVSVFIKESLK